MVSSAQVVAKSLKDSRSCFDTTRRKTPKDKLEKSFYLNKVKTATEVNLSVETSREEMLDESINDKSEFIFLSKPLFQSDFTDDDEISPLNNIVNCKLCICQSRKLVLPSRQNVESISQHAISDLTSNISFDDYTNCHELIIAVETIKNVQKKRRICIY
ncbi:hypothetical protein Glove_348g49 [Diversispora epigaea]|uniref:Uncharacterized protein n=1 Tax=Diversispora epigaea TaxID=1348612 RepID=A0A397HH41_9GLOM|nr:hypothetical protein Glove_348g49 [Diversispora epigaea]